MKMKFVTNVLVDIGIAWLFFSLSLICHASVLLYRQPQSIDFIRQTWGDPNSTLPTNATQLVLWHMGNTDGSESVFQRQ